VRVIDALRRAEAWDDAAHGIATLTAGQPPEAVAQVLALEARLVEAEDAGRHTLASAIRPPARRPHATHGRRAAPSGLLAWLRGLFRR
jgi:hypothetical protein